MKKKHGSPYIKEHQKIIEHAIFVEPIHEGLALPDTIGYPGHAISVTCQFYKGFTVVNGYVRRILISLNRSQ